jgi:hypothetical protein
MTVEGNQNAGACRKRAKAKSKAKFTAFNISDSDSSSASYDSLADQADPAYNSEREKRGSEKRKVGTTSGQKGKGGRKKEKKSPLGNDFLGNFGGEGGGPNREITAHLKKTAAASAAQARYYAMMLDEKEATHRHISGDIAQMNHDELVEFVEQNTLGELRGFKAAIQELQADGADLEHLKEGDLTDNGMSAFHARKALIKLKELCCG